MTRALLSFLLCCCFALTCRAESYDEDTLPADRNHWTVSVSYDLSIPGKWKAGDNSFDMFKPGSGVSLGADYLMFFGKNFFFEPGLRLFYDTYKYDDIIIGSPDTNRTMDPPVKKTGLRIPLTIGYKFDIFKSGSLLLSTGPEPIIGFTARTNFDDNEIESFDEDLYKDTYRRFDLAWDIRAAVIINHFRVDVTGGLGMLDVIKTNVSMHEYRVSIGLGYVF